MLGPVLPSLTFDLHVACDGSASLTPAREGLPPYVQEGPLASTQSAEGLVAGLHHAYVDWDVGDALSDMSLCGHGLGVSFPGALPPASAPECSLPTYMVEAQMPALFDTRGWDSAAAGATSEGGSKVQSHGEQEQEGSASVPWAVRVVPPAQQAVEDAVGLRARLVAREGCGGSSAAWRGFSVSTGAYVPGGKPAMLPAAGDSRPAVVEAESGAWLAELEALQAGRMDSIPAISAPGLTSGVFGAWAAGTDRELPSTSGKGGRSLKGVALKAKQTQQGSSSKPATSVFEALWLMQDDAEDEGDEAAAPDNVPPTAAQPALSRLLGEAAGTGVGGGGGGAAIDGLLDGTAADVEAAAQRQRRSAAAARAKEAATAAGGGGDALARMPLAGQSGASSAGGHQWSVRGTVPDLDARWAELKPTLAIQYPFELDVFQKEAIVHMEGGRSVFVAAHTSAGKTVVAEYAFALATRHCSRAIYTSPIKTISNQKFRDFSGKFEVGLLTGDVQIKTQAPCLIMTTEILRSMLYKGADVIRDIEWVVFDEVHYVNDADRGVVWEEVIIMLPPHVGIVMLSATVPNVMDFADWVGRTKRKIVHVTGTTKRPVPLEHALYYGGEMYTVGLRETFLPEGHRQATLAWKGKNEAGPTKAQQVAARPDGRGGGGTGARGGGQGGGQGRGGFGARGGSADAARKQIAGRGRSGGPNTFGGERQQLIDLIGMLGKKQLLPVAFFCFSKKRCDSSVDGLGGLDLTTSAEKHTIHTFVEKCLLRLGEGDRTLPQIRRLRELMRRGCAVHHAGLLPIMKEVVEMLFCQGYIKVLFCTETFAMGVNAPTRTVVFHSLRKHDGKQHRYLLPSEYTQMAGRAGRRGLDPVGTVLVACWDDIPPEGELRAMLTGRSASLESQFRLTYSMILNLLRVEDLKVEDMLKRSFAEWRAQRSQPKALEALNETAKQLAKVQARPWPGCMLGCQRGELLEYLEVSAQIEALSATLQERLMGSKSVQQALTPGRAVLYLNPVNGLTELALVLGSPDDVDDAGGGGAGAGGAAPKRPVLGLNLGAPRAGNGGDGGSESTGPADRKLWLLILHKPGSVDARHARQADAAREAAAPAPIAPSKSALDDQFQGMVLRVPGGKGGGGGGSGGKGRPNPGPLPRYGELGGTSYLVAEAAARDVVGICKAKIKIEPEELLSGDWDADATRRAVMGALQGMRRTQEEAGGDEPPLLDWRSDLKVADLDTSQSLMERASLMARRASLRPHGCPSLSEQFGVVRVEQLLTRRHAALTHQVSDASLQQMPEFHQRVAVLQQLGYLDEDSTVTLKGRVTCEVNSTQDELVATEMVFAGLLSDLSPEEAVALLSALVFQEKSEVEPELPPALAAARDNLTSLILTAAEVQASHGLAIDPPEYVRQVMHVGLMQVVYEWARGTPFDAICGLTDVMEGSIVRCVVRLDQACRELMDAARVMGNTQLFQQMQAASALIKRDVVFAASLYVA